LAGFVLHCVTFHRRNGAAAERVRGGINVDAARAETSVTSFVPDALYCWSPAEGEAVAVLDYPSPAPLGVIECIERDVGGDPVVYWVWMLDGSRIALDGSTAGERLSRV
jgi:hypothetical protein